MFVVSPFSPDIKINLIRINRYSRPLDISLTYKAMIKTTDTIQLPIITITITTTTTIIKTMIIRLTTIKEQMTIILCHMIIIMILSLDEDRGIVMA